VNYSWTYYSPPFYFELIICIHIKKITTRRKLCGHVFTPPLQFERRYGLPDEQAVFTPQIVKNRQSPNVYAALDCITPKWPPQKVGVTAAATTAITDNDAAAVGDAAAGTVISGNASYSPDPPTGVFLPASPNLFLATHLRRLFLRRLLFPLW